MPMSIREVYTLSKREYLLLIPSHPYADTPFSSNPPSEQGDYREKKKIKEEEMLHENLMKTPSQEE